MRRFHRRKDGQETVLSRIAQTLWYGQIASNYTLPTGLVGYDEEYDYLTLLIDGVYYEVAAKPSVLDE